MSDLDPRYPIGRYHPEPAIDGARRARLIAIIDGTPQAVRSAVEGVSGLEWDKPYRVGGWTIRQVVHHLPDSHSNALTRFRLALTEKTPTIKPYQEAAWALLPDVAITPPEVSLILLDGIHRRWVDLLRALPEVAFACDVFHPEHQRTMNLDELLGIYAWHGRHHVAHIRQARGLEPGEFSTSN